MASHGLSLLKTAQCELPDSSVYSKPSKRANGADVKPKVHFRLIDKTQQNIITNARLLPYPWPLCPPDARCKKRLVDLRAYAQALSGAPRHLTRVCLFLVPAHAARPPFEDQPLAHGATAVVALDLAPLLRPAQPAHVGRQIRKCPLRGKR
eukprot:5778190-Pleurochrysis_carterae.AAC.1